MANKPLRKNDIQVLSDLEHVLKRPQMYAGSTSIENTELYLYKDSKIVKQETPHIPALLKLFDEICSNSLDEAIRSNFKYATKIKVGYDKLTGVVTVEDDGRGLPIEYNEDLKKWTPEIIFTHLKAGSNFNDEEKGMLVGQFGVGGSLVPIFSKKFTVETANGHKYFKQTYENSLAIKSKPILKDDKKNYTFVSYMPNYDYFKVTDAVIESLESLYYKRVKDLAFAYPEITFYFNKEKISASNLKSFLKQIHDVYECNEIDNARIGVFYSDTEFQQMSFVNGAYTSRGGTHVDLVTNKIVEHIRTYLKKKHKLDVKPIDVKSKMFLLLAIRMKNPTFDSQTKERLINNGFKDVVESLLTKKFLDSILKNDEIILPIVESYKLQQQVKENLELKKLNKTAKKVRIEKYFPATKDQNYLVLAEGDSAISSIMPILGREQFSFFPLRGKPLNSLEAPIKKITDNEEIKNIIQILNLRMDVDQQIELTHKNILLAADNDLDGFSIRALCLCLFERFSKSLIKTNRIKFLRTPIMVGFNKKRVPEKYFFDLGSYNEWIAKNPSNSLVWTYYKGLGSWVKEDLQYLIKKDGIDHFIQDFEYDEESSKMINNWMSGKTSDYRKEAIRGKEFNINAI